MKAPLFTTKKSDVTYKWYWEAGRTRTVPMPGHGLARLESPGLVFVVAHHPDDKPFALFIYGSDAPPTKDSLLYEVRLYGNHIFPWEAVWGHENRGEGMGIACIPIARKKVREGAHPIDVFWNTSFHSAWDRNSSRRGVDKFYMDRRTTMSVKDIARKINAKKMEHFIFG